MKKRGFTLIELLAVIVILAIIALIATPIILGIINNAREESQERSAELYLSGVELAIARRNLTEEFRPTECKVVSQTKLDCGEAGYLTVDIDGDAPIGGTLYFDNNKVKDGTSLNYDGFNATVNETGKIEVGSSSKEEQGGSTGGDIPEVEEPTLTQVFKPQFYGNTELSGTIGTAAPAESERLTVAPEGKNYYFGYDVTDEIVTAAYVCFKRNGTEYCLKGYAPGENGTNSEIIKAAFSELVDTSACSILAIGVSCSTDDLFVQATSDGSVTVREGSVSCMVAGTGSFQCY